MNLPQKIAEFIHAESLLNRGSRVIVGLSGGADSIALMSVLHQLGYECVALHCNFGLRGEEAERDASHAEMISRRLGIEFHCVRFATKEFARNHNMSLEMACRELRYNEFERFRNDLKADAIAVGHHREDNVETMLLNLLRGSGLHGIKGMMPRRDFIIRPLLSTPRAEILGYLSSERLPYIVDSSNLENDYKRNRLRNVIIPEILRAFPDAMTTLNESLRNLRDCDTLYRQLLPERSNSLVGVSSTLLHEWLAPFGFNSSQCREIIRAASGARFFSPTHVLTICPGATSYELLPIEETINKPQLRFQTYPNVEVFKPKSGHIYFDAEKFGTFTNLNIELWKEGERMRPFGMTGYRAVSDVMADCGISATKRHRTWLLKQGEEILWIIGYRASSHYPVTKDTKTILEISIDHEDI